MQVEDLGWLTGWLAVSKTNIRWVFFYLISRGLLLQREDSMDGWMDGWGEI